jgi:hypothetical protein
MHSDRKLAAAGAIAAAAPEDFSPQMREQFSELFRRWREDADEPV